jgi:L-rhamnonate dehydratase
MRVTEVRAAYPRWRRLPAVGAWQAHFWQIAVRVVTDAGVIGYGYGGGGQPAVHVVNDHLSRFVVGRSLDNVGDIAAAWDEMYRVSMPYGRGGLAQMALSGVDLALWDALARAERVPVHRLIAPRRKGRVRAYATGGDLELAARYGYTAMKLSHRWRGEADYEGAAELLTAARAALGPQAQLMIDCYLSWPVAVAARMAELLAPYRPYWFEDVATPEHLAELAALRPWVKPVLLAGGEHDFTPAAFAEIARHGALDVWQPDVTWAGGITGVLRILELARTHRIPVVPHRGGEPWGLHLIVASDCLNLAETMPHRWQQPRDELWLGEPEVVDGTIDPGDEPGFGVRLNEDLLAW